jgi:hypothetical protein
MALGKGKKKNVTGTLPRKRTASPATKIGKTGAKGGPKKTAARRTTRSADK